VFDAVIKSKACLSAAVQHNTSAKINEKSENVIHMKKNVNYKGNLCFK